VFALAPTLDRDLEQHYNSFRGVLLCSALTGSEAGAVAFPPHSAEW